jgi:hypothetical protein
MKRNHIIILAVLGALGAVILSGCKSDRLMISSILQNPDKYMDKNVLVAGEVTKTYSVDLLISEAGAYQVDDGSGKIWVITKTGVPREGTKVGLKGTVSSGVKLGRERFGAVIREQERRAK